MAQKMINKPRIKKRTQVRESDLDAVIGQSPPAFETFFISEPKLVFANNGVSVDPKTGIEEFGPFSQGKPFIKVGAIGTGSGIDALREFLEKAKNRIIPGKNSKGKNYDSLAIPDFPGIGPESSFRVDFATDPSIQKVIPEALFESAVTADHSSTKLRQVVDLITKELAALSDQEPSPDVVVLVLPPVVERECGSIGVLFKGAKPVQSAGEKFGRHMEKKRVTSGQEFLALEFDDPSTSEAKGFWNIHHALKAHAMKFGLPTQLAWESKLRGVGLTQDPASVAWNFFTALFYKAGNIPWQIQHIPPNTCFVGISFFKEAPHSNADMQTSLAQVFSGTGDGLVLKGEKAVLDRKRDRRAHLDEFGAEKLLRQALELYEAHHHTRPSRVVVHKTSKFWPEELSGLKKALGSIYRYDFVALEKVDVRFMRMGKEPPLRGTCVTIAPRHHVLYTVGHVPYFGIYPGQYVPAPLEIVEHIGDSTAVEICKEIMALTKVNWNSCNFASSEPITLSFAKSVAKILTEVQPGITPQTKYKFFM